VLTNTECIKQGSNFSVPAIKIIFSRILYLNSVVFTHYQFKADNMGQADKEGFCFAPFTNIPKCILLFSAENRLQLHQT
jgi:hypothetical protein